MNCDSVSGLQFPASFLAGYFSTPYITPGCRRKQAVEWHAQSYLSECSSSVAKDVVEQQQVFTLWLVSNRITSGSCTEGRMGQLPQRGEMAPDVPGQRSPPNFDSTSTANPQMIDEPRRSGRSTKGQHKNLDMVTEGPVKRAKSKSFSKEKSAKPSAEPTPAPSEERGEEERGEDRGEEDEEEEEGEEEGGSEELIRCICGQYEEEEDVERDMICCDKCSAWQHNDCMGLSFPKGEEPDQYYCEKCKPENHKYLLESIANGAKPWEEVAERRRKEAAEKKSTRRKRGRKGGRRGRPSESKTEASTPARSVKARTPSSPPSVPPIGADGTPAQEENEHGDDAPSSGTPKRKFDEHQGSPQSESVSHAYHITILPFVVSFTDIHI